jgi:type III pantothenate kinase
MINLIVDIGNSRTKCYVFNDDESIAGYSFQSLTAVRLKKILSGHKVQNSILSSVIKTKTSLITVLKKNSRFILLNHQTSLPLKNRYRTKETLGNDRIANAAGAIKIFPSRNCLVIDAGTCVKYDFVNAKGEYLGGAISPGLQMRYRSLHDYTSALPLLRPSVHVTFTGTDTEGSITSGVQQGILNEMEGYIRLYNKKYRGLKVILTGGDADRFAHLLNFRIFAAPQLTATGLNEILQHHLTKK